MFDDVSIQVRPPISKNYLADKLERKI